MRVDLDEDGDYEYAFVTLYDGRFTSARYFYRNNDVWAARNLVLEPYDATTDLGEIFRAAKIGTAEPRLWDLKVGELLLQVR